MKKTTIKITERFPRLEKYVEGNKDSSHLNEIESVFLDLIHFVENPSENSFDLMSFYDYLADDHLSFALECLFFFFKYDTYLLKETNFDLITDDMVFYNQSDFTNFLTEHKDKHNINFSRPVLNTYLKRGLVPEPDLTIGKSRFWIKETCEDYLYSLSRKD